MTDDEWGPWIDHDASGCPVPDGTDVRLYWRFKLCGLEDTVTVRIGVTYERWKWDRLDKKVREFGCVGREGIIRYRIRKPRALRDLIETAQTVRSKQEEPA